MKHKRSLEKVNFAKLAIFPVLLMFALMGFKLVDVYGAGTASFNLSPSSGSYNRGSNFTVTIIVKTTDAINAAQADLSYDTSKLQYVGIDQSSSSFNYGLPSSGGGGSVSIARGVSNGGTITGTKTLAKVSFKALTGSGSTSISFKSSSSILRPSDGAEVWNGITTGGTYSLKTTPTSSGGGGSSPSTPSKSTTTKKPTSSSSSNVSQPTQKAQKADPGTPVEVAKKSSENEVTFLVAIRAVDSKSQPLSGSTVTLGGVAKVADDSGVASFANVAAGTYDVTIKKSGKVLGESTITVDANKPASAIQEFLVKAKSPINWSLLVKAGLAVLALVLVIGFFKAGGPGKLIKHTEPKLKAGPSGSMDEDNSSPVTTATTTTIAPGGAVIKSASTPASSKTTKPAAKTMTGTDNLIKPNIISPSPKS